MTSTGCDSGSIRLYLLYWSSLVITGSEATCLWSAATAAPSISGTVLAIGSFARAVAVSLSAYFCSDFCC